MSVFKQLAKLNGYFALQEVFKPTVQLIAQLNQRQAHLNYRGDRKYYLDFTSKLLSNNNCTTSSSSFSNLIRQMNSGLYLLVRASELIGLFGPVIVFGGLLVQVGLMRRERFYRWLRWSLRVAGSTFTKLGQWGATRPDVLPRELCTILSQLHSSAGKHSMAWNRHVIREAFGVELDVLFEEFKEIPIGSGTIGQVHEARIQGIPVAVKITHPGIRDLIDRDLLVLRVGARLLDRLIPGFEWLALPEEVDFFSQIMREQVDLRFEGFTLHRFNRNFERTSRSWGRQQLIKFPIPLYPFVSERVLIETLIEGVPVAAFYPHNTNKIEDHIINHTGFKIIQEGVARTGLQAFLQMLLWDNFVHADLHPGNILVTFTPVLKDHSRIYNLMTVIKNFMRKCVTPGRIEVTAGSLPVVINEPCRHDTSDDGYLKAQASLVQNHQIQAQLVFLDTGLVTELNHQDFNNFSDLFMALVLHGDGYEAGHLMIERSPEWSRNRVINPEGFCTAMHDLVQPLFPSLAKTTRLTELSIAPTLEHVFELVRRHHVRVDPAFTNLVMSLLCVEGLGREMAPEMDLRPLLAQAALQYLVTTVAKTVSNVVSPILMH